MRHDLQMRAHAHRKKAGMKAKRDKTDNIAKCHPWEEIDRSKNQSKY